MVKETNIKNLAFYYSYTEIHFQYNLSLIEEGCGVEIIIFDAKNIFSP